MSTRTERLSHSPVAFAASASAAAHSKPSAEYCTDSIVPLPPPASSAAYPTCR